MTPTRLNYIMGGLCVIMTAITIVSVSWVNKRKAQLERIATELEEITTNLEQERAILDKYYESRY